ncbi:MAG: hypothetical protein, partial [Olavius algarvensis Gamma 3 endosymbiont]
VTRRSDSYTRENSVLSTGARKSFPAAVPGDRDAHRVLHPVGHHGNSHHSGGPL